eukprot:TRINITY_DN223_c0_g4_i1.p1 TRINITY_DN223_c0_g4~~TRINITY_DN223_c0_g4_i1.p1  ORF type:complete len:444 (+),score=127.52 TRINITY_DN223_c0_g4_i1:80-1411(+)
MRPAAALGAVWAAALLWGECGVFMAGGPCRRWRAERGGAGAAPWGGEEGWPCALAAVADPQLTDAFSYGMAPGSAALAAAEHVSDVYMRRAFRWGVVWRERPADVLLLGDLFDGGRVLSDVDWAAHLARLEAIFPGSTRSGGRFWHVAGNHDVGLGRYHNCGAAARWAAAFGPRNAQKLFGGGGVHTAALVDAPAWTHQDHLRPPNVDTPCKYCITELTACMQEEVRAAAAFTEDAARRGLPPLLAATHIPLWRPNQPCGNPRQRPGTAVEPLRGMSYQNTLPQQATADILAALDPVLVLSGDDHDTCAFLHPTGVLEITVPTFSWLQGQRIPGFAAVRPDPSGAPRVVVDVCPLPDQRRIYSTYGALLCLSAAAIFTKPLWAADPYRREKALADGDAEAPRLGLAAARRRLFARGWAARVACSIGVQIVSVLCTYALLLWVL